MIKTNRFFETYPDYSFRLIKTKSTTDGTTTNDNLTATVKFIGGSVLTNNSLTKVLVDDTKKATVTYDKGTNGYTRFVTTKSGASIPTSAYITAAGESVYLAKDAANTTETEFVYQLAYKTSYDYIPAEYDAQTYPFAMFDNTGKFMGVYKNWSVNNDTTSVVGYLRANYHADKYYQILLRRDYNCYDKNDNHGGLDGSLLLDLNNHKMTTKSTAPLFMFQAKVVNRYYQKITIQNGELCVDQGNLFHISAYIGSDRTKDKELTITLNNVTISRVSTGSNKPQAIVAYVFDTAGSTYAATTVLTLNNCIIDTTNAPVGEKLPLFALANTMGNKTTVKMNGGIIKAADMTDVSIYTLSESGDSFTFGKYSDTYTKLETSGAVPTTKFTTAEGEMVFTASGTDGVYVLALYVPDIEVEGGSSYESIQDAFDNAMAGDVIVLNKDTAGANLTVNNATLDLNGNVLTADGLVAFDKLIIVDSGSGTKGLIKIEKGNITEADIVVVNGVLVYNEKRGGYEVAEVIDQKSYTADTDNGTFELIFRPSFESTDYNQEILGNGGDEADIKILVNIVDANGKLVKGFVFTDDLVKQAYSGKLAFKLTVRNIPSNLGTLTIEYVVASGASEDCVINAGTYTA